MIEAPHFRADLTAPSIDEPTVLPHSLKVFFDSSGVLYDYVLTSGLYDLLAKEFKFETIPVSEIKKDQQLIIKDNRPIKSNQMTLEEIDECYDSINPIIDDSSSGETLNGKTGSFVAISLCIAALLYPVKGIFPTTR